MKFRHCHSPPARLTKWKFHQACHSHIWVTNWSKLYSNRSHNYILSALSGRTFYSIYYQLFRAGFSIRYRSIWNPQCTTVSILRKYCILSSKTSTSTGHVTTYFLSRPFQRFSMNPLLIFYGSHKVHFYPSSRPSRQIYGKRKEIRQLWWAFCPCRFSSGASHSTR